MTSHEKYLAARQFRSDYELYVNDHQLMRGVIQDLSPQDARSVLWQMVRQAPFNAAKALAIVCPLPQTNEQTAVCGGQMPLPLG